MEHRPTLPPRGARLVPLVVGDGIGRAPSAPRRGRTHRRHPVPGLQGVLRVALHRILLRRAQWRPAHACVARIEQSRRASKASLRLPKTVSDTGGDGAMPWCACRRSKTTCDQDLTCVVRLRPSRWTHAGRRPLYFALGFWSSSTAAALSSLQWRVPSKPKAVCGCPRASRLSASSRACSRACLAAVRSAAGQLRSQRAVE